MATVATLQNRISRVSTEFASLDAAVAALGANDAVLTLAPGDTKTLTDDLTIPANVTLLGQMGVIATNGHTLTVNGPCPVVDYQMFDVSGGGSVVGLAECTPRMFGAIGNDTGADDLPPMQAAVNAVKDRAGTVQVRRGTYTLGDGTTISAQLFLYSGVTLRGDGRGITTIKSNKLIEASDGSSAHRTQAPLIRSESWRNVAADIVENITVEGISFEGQRTNESFSTAYEFYAIIAVSGIRHATFRDLSFKNVHGDALNIGPSHLDATEPDFNRDITVENIYIENCLRGGVTCVSGVGIRIRNVEGTGEGAPIHLEPGQSAPYATLKDVHVTDFNLHDGSNWPPIWIASGNSGPDYLAGITIENGVIRDWSNTDRGWDYFMLFGAAGGTFRNVKFYDCVTDAPVFFRAVGSRIDIEGCEWWNCSMEGANAAVFWQQFTYPTSGGDSAVDAAGFRWNGNKAFGCVNTLGFSGASPATNSRFFGMRDDGNNSGTLFTNNTVYCGGFYHGTVADEEGVLQFGNIIVADSNLVQGSDPNAGQRGIYTAGASGAAIILGNISLGWATAIHNASTHPQIGHNYGVVYHQGFTATGTIT